MPKYGGLAKLYLEEPAANTQGDSSEDLIRLEYHMFPENIFCTGAAFVPKQGGTDEDDGWIITFVHNEATDVSQVSKLFSPTYLRSFGVPWILNNGLCCVHLQVYIVDAKRFSSEPVAKLTIPCRVPYGFHGSYMPLSSVRAVLPSCHQ